MLICAIYLSNCCFVIISSLSFIDSITIVLIWMFEDSGSWSNIMDHLQKGQGHSRIMWAVSQDLGDLSWGRDCSEESRTCISYGLRPLTSRDIIIRTLHYTPSLVTEMLYRQKHLLNFRRSDSTAVSSAYLSNSQIGSCSTGTARNWTTRRQSGLLIVII